MLFNREVYKNRNFSKKKFENSLVKLELFKLFNKKGEFSKQIMIIPFLFLIIVIALGIALGVGLYYGPGYDFRNVDASALSNRVEKCLNENSNLLLDANKFYETCKIKKEVLENSKFILKVCKGLSLEDCASSENYIISSGSGFENCFLTGAKENKGYLKCSGRDILIDGVKISIVAGSNQQIKRINT